MGEGWGDWYAKDFIVNQFPQLDTAAAGRGRHRRLHRPRSALDPPPGARLPGHGATASSARPAAPAPGGFTYGDFGKVNGEPEVHGDGEIWAETLWDLRGAIGSVNARRLITQGMRLSPPEPSFLDMRNAILQADAAEGGTRRTQIWQVFANRGMGFYAATTGRSTSRRSRTPRCRRPAGRAAGSRARSPTPRRARRSSA